MSIARTLVLALSALVLGAGCGVDETKSPVEGTGGGGGAAEAPLAAEAGFFDLPRPEAGPLERGRMFFSFQPADPGVDDAPLAVFFNGGPGEATSAILLPFGTGPMTLDARATGPLVPAPNPHSWTRFANLLYLDTRDAGFSYEVGGIACDAEDDQKADGRMVADAADLVIGTLDFLAAHPSLRSRPVVFVGESYGGTRAALIWELLLHYADPIAARPRAPSFDLIVPSLSARIQAHVDATRPDLLGRAATVAEMSAQFGHGVLIEPAFSAMEMEIEARYFDRDEPELAKRVGTMDPYDLFRTQLASDALWSEVYDAMEDPRRIEALLGVELRSIRGLAAAERGRAARFQRGGGWGGERPPFESALSAELGVLTSRDVYWMPVADMCRMFPDSMTEIVALGVLPEVDAFITRAKYDAVVHTKALPKYWRTLGLKASIDESSPAGAARPGMLDVELPSGRARIRFPEYASGHEVTMTAGPELAADVEAWLRERGVVK
jgi:Serine carboxypeptidase